MEKSVLELSLQQKEKTADFFTVQDKDYGERLFVRDGESYKEVTKPQLEPVHIHKNRTYTTHTAEAFISYVGKYGDIREGIIFYSENGLIMFFSEKARDESVNLPFTLSLEVLTFLGPQNLKNFTQKDFVKTLDAFSSIVKDYASIVPNIERLQLKTTLEFDGDTSADTYTFIYQGPSGKQTGSIPKQINLRAPIFEGSKNIFDIKLDLEIKQPQDAKEKAICTLTCPMFDRIRREAVEAEVKDINEALTDWLFIQGKTKD